MLSLLSTNTRQGHGLGKEKKVREKSRECHNHKPQPFPDPKRKRKPTNLNKHKPNRRTKSTKISSLFPKRGNRNTKRTEKHKNKMTHGKTYNKSQNLRKTRSVPKTAAFVTGPCLIVQKYNDLAYRVQLSKWGLLRQVLHHNKIKPYEDTNIPRWLCKAKLALIERHMEPQIINRFCRSMLLFVCLFVVVVISG